MTQSVGAAGCGFIAFVMAAPFMANLAAAGETLIRAEIGSNRDPYDFADPTSNKYELTVFHTFDNGVLITGMGEVSQTLFTPSFNENLEGTVGYTQRFNTAFSMTGRVGVGELFEDSDDGGDFPYYVAYLSADLNLTAKFAWNVVSLRYRNAFDTANDYDTPQIATGVTYKLDDHNWILAKVSRSGQDGEPHDTGVTLGYQYGF
jgi:hypothetical protein